MKCVHGPFPPTAPGYMGADTEPVPMVQSRHTLQERVVGAKVKAFEIFEEWLRITRQKRLCQAEGTACLTIYIGAG